MSSIKGDLQRLGPLEVNVDSMLEKPSLLERMEKMLQKWENSERGSSSEEKKNKSSNPKDPNISLVTTMPEESSIGARSNPKNEPRLDAKPEESHQPPRTSKIDIGIKSGGRVESLTRRLEISIFEGWNPEGWIFWVERFFLANKMTEEEKMEAATISLDGETLVGFQWEENSATHNELGRVENTPPRSFPTNPGGYLM